MSERYWAVETARPTDRGRQVTTCHECHEPAQHFVVLKCDYYHYVCLPCLKAMAAELEATVTMSGTWTWTP